MISRTVKECLSNDEGFKSENTEYLSDYNQVRLKTLNQTCLHRDSDRLNDIHQSASDMTSNDQHKCLETK